ncbi:Methylcrotonoyl-CoA carboxylase subunit alpha [Ceratobasidium theobromae]|uniref:Methylcrotonoyl-CoA carboxylase subunit alpha n=1 Tax=Ceratobasidium theobromae TaxID=1582974 RepID=A0A5N5QS93_9AGAM|nr:Methylcrotonoyl-CoA carboxylase subunit alpha [Ceratobasidium theobromae]
MSFLRVASRNVTTSVRRYSTAPPAGAKSSNLPLLLGIGGLLGLGAYVYADKAGPKPAKALVSALDKDNFKEFTVKRVDPYNHNTAKWVEFTLEFPSGQATLLPVAGLVYVKALESDPRAPKDKKGNPIGRPYTPISDPHQEGEVTFMIKRYDTGKYLDGKLTPYIHSLKPGDKVAVKGPISKRPWNNNEFEHVVMIAGGSGITPMYQILRHALSQPEDKTNFKLLFGNVTPADVLLKEEFDQLRSKHGDRFEVVYVVDKGDKDWTGPTGFITKDLLKKEIAPASLGEKVMVFVCGPPAQVDAIAGKKDGMKQGPLGGALKDLGYTSEQGKSDSSSPSSTNLNMIPTSKKVTAIVLRQTSSGIRKAALPSLVIESARGLSTSSNVHSRQRTAFSSQLGYTDRAGLHRGFATFSPPRVKKSVTTKPLFDKILIANRGEIACRVIRTARKLGVKTVAVYSEVDRDALHVKMADEAYCIGPAPSSESYLRMDKIIDVAKRSGAQAVHPGYGFLSENAIFAQQLANAGLTFIGPPAPAITAMASKSESKDIMTRAGVPCVPGYHGVDQLPAKLLNEAKSIGFPVLIKAVLGGGGKGMKIVDSASEFDEALASAQREAAKSFGDSRVLVEKYIEHPRHVEVQVFGDSKGDVVSLWERDCSVQRRHQKIIEEAPAPGLSEDVRRDLGEKAVAAAKAVGYVGAGTVEFIFDNDTQQFYFMEMNTRLQVEHPITEMITQQDLVQWQLEVASGNPLPLQQHEIPRTGHAFEARIYAENPRNNFMPDVGPLLHLTTPVPSESVRLEDGFKAGSQIEVFYDPLIAKLVVHGRDRTEALRVLRKALEEYHVVGLSTNIEFLHTLASHSAFIRGEVETGFIKKYHDELFPPIVEPAPELLAQAALFVVLRDQPVPIVSSPWTTLPARRFGGDLHERRVVFQHESLADAPLEATITSISPGRYKVQVITPTTNRTFDNVSARLEAGSSTSIECTLENALRRTTIVPQSSPGIGLNAAPERLHVFHAGAKTVLNMPPPNWLLSLGNDLAKSIGGGSIRAPMPSVVVEVKVRVGDVVTKGDIVVVLESMKTETVLRAAIDGAVKNVGCTAGEMVEEGRELVGIHTEVVDG